MPDSTSLAAYLPPITEDAPAAILHSLLFIAAKDSRHQVARRVNLSPELLEALGAKDRVHPDSLLVMQRNKSLAMGTGGLVAPRVPRDVPWTALPLIGTPAWKPTRELWDILRVRDLADASWLQAVVVVLNGHDPYLPDLVSHARLETLLGRRLKLFLLSPDDSLAQVPEADIDAAEQQVRALGRFRLNWSWNIRALMPALVAEAFRTRRPPGSTKTSAMALQAPEEAALAAIARSPWLLQVLYRVAETHPKPLPYPRSRETLPLYDRAQSNAPILTGAGLTRRSGEQTHRVDWTGHRIASDLPEHDPARRTFTRLLSEAIDAAQQGHLLLATSGRPPPYRLREIRGEAVVEWQGPQELPEPGIPERQARLSPAGAALLRLLPPGCRDLGMPTRWMTEEGHVGTPGDIPAMDRWLTTMLRHIKKAANGLQAG